MVQHNVEVLIILKFRHSGPGFSLSGSRNVSAVGFTRSVGGAPSSKRPTELPAVVFYSFCSPDHSDSFLNSECFDSFVKELSYLTAQE